MALFVELLFNDTSTLVGHFVSSPRERKKWDRRASRGEEKEKLRRRRKTADDSAETEEIITYPLPHLLQVQQALTNTRPPTNMYKHGFKGTGYTWYIFKHSLQGGSQHSLQGVEDLFYILAPVVQSIVSLTSSLVVKMLTVLVSTISNSQVFLLKNCE